MQVSIGGDLEIEQRLDAYARVRLSPTERASARMRARVMREARLAMAAASPASVTSADRPGPRAAPRRPAATRCRPAARCGSVTRGRRRGHGRGAGRRAALSDADVARDDHPAGRRRRPRRRGSRATRITHAGGRRGGSQGRPRRRRGCASRLPGDRRRGAPGGNGDAAAIDRVRLALDRHLAVLEAVAAKVPAQASEAIGRNIDRAIERNGATLDRIQSNKGGGGPAAQPGPAAKPDKTPKPAAKPAAEPTPVRTQRPQPTPAATEPPKGPPNPKPDKTPPGHGRSQEP